MKSKTGPRVSRIISKTLQIQIRIQNPLRNPKLSFSQKQLMPESLYLFP